MRRNVVGLVAKFFVLICSLGLAFASRAETIKVFAHNLGQVLSQSSAGIADIRNLLNDATKDVDFGYFCGPKGESYFEVTDDNYAFDNKMVAMPVGGIHVVAYRADRYDLVGRYDKLSIGNGGVDACVLQDKITRSLYCLLMPTGNQFNISSSSKINAYVAPVRSLFNTCRADYPTAKIFVGTTKGWSATDAALTAYLTQDTYMGLGEARVYAEDGTAEAGGIYFEKDPTLTVSVANVSVSGITEPATVATLTYGSGCTVTFKDWDGTVLSTVTVASGGTADAPQDPVREGYEFLGWEGSYENVTMDTVVTATYVIKTFEVTFVDSDGTVLKRETVGWGASATAPEAPEKEGLAFLRWDPADFSCVTGPLTVTAVYEEVSNILVVRFLDADGTVLKTEQVIRGESATAPANPSPQTEGHLFYGWSPADFSNITANLDVTAVYGPAVLEIGTGEAFAAAVANLPAAATLKLTADVDLADVAYTAPNLYGVLDGNGHSVAHLTTALFGTVSGGTVRDLTLSSAARTHTAYNLKGALLADRLEGATITGVTVENSTFSSQKQACGLAMIAYWATTNETGKASVISNCVARNCTLTAVTGSILGGIVGETYANTEVVDCKFQVTDPTAVALGRTTQNSGGIIGASHGAVVTRCEAEGTFLGAAGSQYSAVGGIIGEVDGETTLVACTNRANVTFSSYNGCAGGLVGRTIKSSCAIRGCVNFGSASVSGDEDSVSNLGCGAGGLIGGGWGDVFLSCADSRNEGAVVAEDFRPAGGLLGNADGTSSGDAHVFLTNCVNTARATSEGHAGGLVGRINKINDDLTIVNCGNAGAIHSATGSLGGVIGYLAGKAQNNDKNFAFTRIANVMNCGALTTESGTVGSFVGSLKGSERNAYALPLKSVFLLARADTNLAGEIEGKEGTAVTADEASLTQLPAEAFTKRQAVKALNLYAAANSLPLWVQAREYPDLSLFAKERTTGLFIIIR